MFAYGTGTDSRRSPAGLGVLPVYSGGAPSIPEVYGALGCLGTEAVQQLIQSGKIAAVCLLGFLDEIFYLLFLVALRSCPELTILMLKVPRRLPQMEERT